LIALTNLNFEFNTKVLYDEASWHIKPRERIGLIGLNGTGKSTLLRLINGEYQLPDGVISSHRDLTIGFLNQDLLSYNSDDSILSVALQAFANVLQLEKEIEEVLKKLEYDHSDEVIHELSDKQHEFERLDGYNIHHKAEEILEGLGFSTEQLQQPLRQFSGGWRMRVMLAKLLLQKPQLLMLDEPTNHLDLPSIQWLENYLQKYEGTVIIVSHDRFFLDRMVTKIVEVINQKLVQYPGNYSNYLQEKELREDIQDKQFKNQQQYIKEQERFIERFKAKASKAKAAQSRVKLLEKLDRVDAVAGASAKINVRFRVAKTSGKVVCELKDIDKSFGDLHLLHKAHGIVERGDKIALIGANGKGKSTLLRIIANTESFQGERIPGHNVHTSFFAQHQLESLHLENDILSEVKSERTDKLENEVRTVLGSFLFSNDEVFKKIKVLSGGEKARVALAKMLISEANFLLLDEPTNHLDMQSINVLTQALQDYDGTFVVVSHDRYFVSQIANKIWWIEDQQIKEYPGTYDEFDEWNKLRLLVKKESKAPTQPTPKKEKEQKKALPDSAQKEKQQELKKLNQTFAELEKNLAEMKKSKEAIELKLSDPAIMKDEKKLKDLNEEYKNIQVRLDKAGKDYETVFSRMLELEED
jgi:ATP-binding cassette subfamily F protein 3